MPRAFTENEKQRIRAMLMEQGERQFSSFGLKKTSVEELAQASGISKAAFYLFFESKEALFMDVVEQAEQRFRTQVLAAVDQPGPTPRARLAAVLRTAFSLWRTIPLLHFFTSSDYEQIARRIPPEKIQEHLNSDRVFLQDLNARLQAASIPVKVSLEEIGALMYVLFFAVLHENDLGPGMLAHANETLIELVAAYWLGEIETAPLPAPFPSQGK